MPLLAKSEITENKIRQERKCELAFEDHVFWDLRRWRIAVKELNNVRRHRLHYRFNAIYEGADEWKYSDGTDLTGDVLLTNGKKVDASKSQIPVSDEFYFIVTDKCTECKGFHEEPQCAAVCRWESG